MTSPTATKLIYNEERRWEYEVTGAPPFQLTVDAFIPTSVIVIHRSGTKTSPDVVVTLGGICGLHDRPTAATFSTFSWPGKPLTDLPDWVVGIVGAERLINSASV
jgi:hypothetical protein